MENVLVAQSGGPTAVINATLAGVIAAACAESKMVYGAVHGIEGVIAGELVNLSEKFSTKDQLDLLSHTPASYLGTCRYRLPDSSDKAVYEQVFAVLDKFEIGYFIYIGGNDSMDTVAKLSKYAEEIGSDVKIVGAPKTIDNDLAITDHTPGFGSAAKYVATSMREIVLDSKVYNKKTLTVVEIMGRNAGWLTAAAALARGNGVAEPHFIYLPEVTFDIETFFADVENMFEKVNNVIIAVSEGVKTANGKYVCEYNAGTTAKDAFGHAQLSGTAATLVRLIEQRMPNIKSRAIEFSLLQRAAAHVASETDRCEAFNVGEAAAKAALSGKSGVMMLFERVSNSPYKMEIKEHDVASIANAEKKVPREWINAKGNDVKQEFIDYAKPLIFGESTPKFEDGLPVFAVLVKENILLDKACMA